MMEATGRAIENDEKKIEFVQENHLPKKKPAKKPKFKKLTINDLLERSCWNPENFEDWHEWQNKQIDGPIETISVYPGIRLYDIQLHCTQFVIRARRHENGGYQIFDFIEKEH